MSVSSNEKTVNVILTCELFHDCRPDEQLDLAQVGRPVRSESILLLGVDVLQMGHANEIDDLCWVMVG